MKENNNVKALDELHKGCCMGVDSLKCVLEKVDEGDFKDLLEDQYNFYKELGNEIELVYSNYCEDCDECPDCTSKMNKVMTWSGIQMNTMKDDSNSKIAELLVQGTDMGVIEGRKLLNHKNMDKEVKKFVNKYIKEQEKYIDKLKKYL